MTVRTQSYAHVYSQGALSICTENPVILVGNHFSTRKFRKKMEYHQSYSSLLELPENHCSICFIPLPSCSMIKYVDCKLKNPGFHRLSTVQKKHVRHVPFFEKKKCTVPFDRKFSQVFFFFHTNGKCPRTWVISYPDQNLCVGNAWPWEVWVRDNDVGSS